MYRLTLEKVAESIIATLGDVTIDRTALASQIESHRNAKRGFDFIIVANGKQRKTRVTMTALGYRVGFTK